MGRFTSTDSVSPVHANEGEITRLRTRAAELAGEIAAQAAELQILDDEVRGFVAEYERRFGSLLLELERLEAEIAELIALRNRHHAGAQAAAREARSRADDAARRHAEVEREDAVPPPPTDELKHIYRRLAFSVHPDRAQNDADRAQRTAYMAEVNVAYQERDLGRLRDLERRWAFHETPGERTAQSTLDDLRARVDALQREREHLETRRRAVEASESHRLFRWIQNAGPDREVVYASVETDLHTRIAEAAARLAALSNETNAASGAT